MNDMKYVFRLLVFLKPYAIPYSIGLFLVSLQDFLLTYIIASLNSNATLAIMEKDLNMAFNAGLIVIAMIAAFILIVCIGIWLMYINATMGTRLMKRDLFRAFMAGSLEDSIASHSGEGIAAINTDADTASNIYKGSLRGIITTIFSIVLSTIVVFRIDWRLGFAAVGIGIIALLVQQGFAKPIAVYNKKRLDANTENVKHTSNILSGAVLIKSYNMQNKAADDFDKKNTYMKKLDYGRGIISLWIGSLSIFQVLLTTVAVFAFGGWLVINDQLEFHMLMMMPALCVSISSNLGAIGRQLAYLREPIEGAKRVFAILDNAAAVTKHDKHDGTAKNKGYTLVINDLSFTYKNAEKPAVNNINLEIAEKQLIAFVGESGSGKSTLLKTITGFYDRENLGISIGGAAFNECSAVQWRKNFAIVDQSCKLFDMSIKENIAMGLSGNAKEDDIITAAKRAAAHDFIKSLPEEYDAPCGEKGGVLSGGQKQRIAIARALVKGTPILVFDEAASALDKDSERYIMDTIESLRDDHTILISTHNLENIVRADKIVVMDNGQIVETGTHHELIAIDGLYKKLYEHGSQHNLSEF